MFRILLFCFFGVLSTGLFAQTRTLDSLRKLVAKRNLPDTTQILATLELAYEIRYSKSDSSILLVRKAMTKARQIKFEKGIGTGLYVEGIWFSFKGKYQEALENYFKALDIYEKIKFEKGTARILNNIGIIYYYQKNYDKAEIFLNKSLVINQKIKNYSEIARTYNNLGRNLLEKNKPQEALENFRKAIALLKKYNVSTDVSVYFCNVAEALYMLKQPDEALVNAEKSLEIARKVSNKRVEARSCVVQGMIYLELNDIQKAQRFLEQGTPIARNLKFPEEHLLALEHSYKLYEKIKNYEKAYLFLKAFKAHSDSVVNDVNYKIILQREYEYNEQQRKLKNEYNEQQRKIERRNEIWIRYSLIAGVLLAFGLVFFAYRAFMVKSKAFRIISQQQEELQVMNEELIQNQEEIITQRNFIEEQNANLSSKNEQITQSITTALAIQKALLPFDNRVKQFLKEYFVLYQPRDIVSGDFYWIERVENKAVIVAADCTGHGVPGAFMSLVAINLLERVVLQQEITVPSLILHELHDLVRIALKQDEIENQSGMDLAVVMLDLPEENYTEVTLHFAGAKRPLHYIDALNPTKVGKIAGSRRAIGGFQNETISFEETSLTLPKGSTFYISSDGLADQNNKQRKRLTDAPILEVLLAHYPSLPTQHEAIQAILNAQMEGTTQRDDILFLGIKC